MKQLIWKLREIWSEKNEAGAVSVGESVWVSHEITQAEVIIDITDSFSLNKLWKLKSGHKRNIFTIHHRIWWH